MICRRVLFALVILHAFRVRTTHKIHKHETQTPPTAVATAAAAQGTNGMSVAKILCSSYTSYDTKHHHVKTYTAGRQERRETNKNCCLPSAKHNFSLLLRKQIFFDYTSPPPLAIADLRRVDKIYSPQPMHGVPSSLPPPAHFRIFRACQNGNGSKTFLRKKKIENK